MNKVQFELTDIMVQEMLNTMPFAVQVRIMLNKAGFKFADDNKPSLIINENPQPLGKLTVWKSIETNSTFYVQTNVS